MRDGSGIASTLLGGAMLKGAAIFQVTCEHSLANLLTYSLFLLRKCDWRLIATNKSEYNSVKDDAGCLSIITVVCIRHYDRWKIHPFVARLLNAAKNVSSSLHPYPLPKGSVEVKDNGIIELFVLEKASKITKSNPQINTTTVIKPCPSRVCISMTTIVHDILLPILS